MKSKPVLMFVHPDFKKRIKVGASLKNTSIINYTKQLSGSKSLEEEFKESEAERKSGFKYKY